MEIGRYVTKDQFILYDTSIFKIVIHVNILTVFIYSMNNPCNRIDIDGLGFISDCCKKHKTYSACLNCCKDEELICLLTKPKLTCYLMLIKCEGCCASVECKRK